MAVLTEDLEICVTMLDLVNMFVSYSPIIVNWINNEPYYMKELDQEYCPTYNEITNSKKLSITLYKTRTLKSDGTYKYSNGKTYYFNGKKGLMPMISVKKNASMLYAPTNLVRVIDVVGYYSAQDIVFSFGDLEFDSSTDASNSLSTNNLSNKTINVNTKPVEISYTLDSSNRFSFTLNANKIKDYRTYKSYTLDFYSQLDPSMNSATLNSTTNASGTYVTSGTIASGTSYTINNVCDSMTLLIDGVKKDLAKVFVTTDGTMDISINNTKAITAPINRYTFTQVPDSNTFAASFSIPEKNASKYDRMFYDFYDENGNKISSVNNDHVYNYSENPTLTYNNLTDTSTYQLVVHSVEKYQPKKITYRIYNMQKFPDISTDIYRLNTSMYYDITSSSLGNLNDVCTYIINQDNKVDLKDSLNSSTFVPKYFDSSITTIDNYDEVFNFNIKIPKESTVLYDGVTNENIKSAILSIGQVGAPFDTSTFSLDSNNDYVTSLTYKRAIYDNMILSVRLSSYLFIPIDVSTSETTDKVYQSIGIDTKNDPVFDDNDLLDGKNNTTVYTNSFSPRAITLEIDWTASLHNVLIYTWTVNNKEEVTKRITIEEEYKSSRKTIISRTGMVLGHTYGLTLKHGDIDRKKSINVIIKEYSTSKSDLADISDFSYTKADGTESSASGTKSISGPDITSIYTTTYNYSDIKGKAFTVKLKSPAYSYKYKTSPVLTYTYQFTTSQKTVSGYVDNWTGDSITLTSDEYSTEETNITLTIQMKEKDHPKLYGVVVNENQWIGLKVYNQDTKENIDLSYTSGTTTPAHTWYSSNTIKITPSRTSISNDASKYPNFKLIIRYSNDATALYTNESYSFGTVINTDNITYNGSNITTLIDNSSDSKYIIFDFYLNVSNRYMYIVNETTGTNCYVNAKNTESNKDVLIYEQITFDYDAFSNKETLTITPHYPAEYIKYTVSVYYATSDITPGASGWTLYGNAKTYTISENPTYTWTYGYNAEGTSQLSNGYYYKVTILAKKDDSASLEIVDYGSNKNEVLTISGSSLDMFPTYEDATWYVGVRAYTDDTKTTKATLTTDNLSFQDYDSHHSILPEFFEVIKVEEVAGEDAFEFVDLGLPSGVLWANKNVGAYKISDFGNYYAFGETSTKENYSWSTYKWGTSDTALTKYNNKSGYGTVDNIKELESDDDIAYITYNSSYSGSRMPSLDDANELKNNCTFTYETLNGVNGLRATGPNGNSIFLPDAGYYQGTSFLTYYAYYWTRRVDTGGDPEEAWNISFGNGYTTIDVDTDMDRYHGCSIRAIKNSSYEKLRYVDLGLTSGTLWANKNIGADTSTGYGAYYQWGDTEDYATKGTALNWSTYKFGTGSGLTKYCNNAAYGTVDNLTTLESSDDVADELYDSECIMPSVEQLQELYDECTWTWTTINSINGFLVSSKTNSNKIFIPASGYISENTYNSKNTQLYYWSNSVDTNACSQALSLYTSSNQSSITTDMPYPRCYGLTIRAVATTKATRTRTYPDGAVDLGLPSGLRWSKYNVGATSLYDYGEYFMWAGTSPGAVTGGITGSPYYNGSSYTKYNSTDGLTTLESSDDAATSNMGSLWRMPTVEEVQELIDNTYTGEYHVNGVWYVTYTANSDLIFVPAGGYLYYDGSYKFRNIGEDLIYCNIMTSQIRTNSGSDYVNSYCLAYVGDSISVPNLLYKKGNSYIFSGNATLRYNANTTHGVTEGTILISGDYSFDSAYQTYSFSKQSTETDNLLSDNNSIIYGASSTDLTHIFTVKTIQDFINYYIEYKADNYLNYFCFEHLNSSNQTAYKGYSYSNGAILSYKGSSATKTINCDEVSSVYFFDDPSAAPSNVSYAYDTPRKMKSDLILNKTINTTEYTQLVYYKQSDSGGATVNQINTKNVTSSSNITISKILTYSSNFGSDDLNTYNGSEIIFSVTSQSTADLNTYITVTVDGRKATVYMPLPASISPSISFAYDSTAYGGSDTIEQLASDLISKLRTKYITKQKIYNTMLLNAYYYNYGTNVNPTRVAETKDGNKTSTSVNYIDMLKYIGKYTTGNYSLSGRLRLVVGCTAGTNVGSYPTGTIMFYTPIIKGYLEDTSKSITSTSSYYITTTGDSLDSTGYITIYVSDSALNTGYSYIFCQTDAYDTYINNTNAVDSEQAFIDTYNSSSYSHTVNGNFQWYTDTLNDDNYISDATSITYFSRSYIRIAYRSGYTTSDDRGILRTTACDGKTYDLITRATGISDTNTTWYKTGCQLKIHSGIREYFLNSISSNVYYKGDERTPTSYTVTINMYCVDFYAILEDGTSSAGKLELYYHFQIDNTHMPDEDYDTGNIFVGCWYGNNNTTSYTFTESHTLYVFCEHYIDSASYTPNSYYWSIPINFGSDHTIYLDVERYSTSASLDGVILTSY